MADEKNPDELWSTNTVYLVDIHVVSGNNLLPMDNLNSKKADKHSSDPFVVISCLDGNGGVMGATHRTETVKSSLTPTWKKGRKMFEFLRRPDVIKLQVMDEDRGRSDDKMGHYEIKDKELERLFKENSEGWDRNCELTMPQLSEKEKKSKALAGRDSAGTIKVVCTCKELDLVNMVSDLAMWKSAPAFNPSGNPEADLREAEDLYKQKQREKGELQNEYQSLQKSVRTLKSTKNALDSEVRQLERDTEQAHSDFDRVKREAADIKAKVDVLENQNNSAVDNALIKRIDEYIDSIADQKSVSSGKLFKDVVAAYKASRDSAADEESVRGVESGFRNQMQQWRKKYEDVCSNGLQRGMMDDTFNALYQKANLLLFSLQVTGATISVFKNSFGNSRAITLESMTKELSTTNGASGDAQQEQDASTSTSSSAWAQVWPEMDFVMEDLGETLGEAKLSNLPLKRLCDKTTAIIDELYAGSSMLLAREVADSVTNELQYLAENGSEPEDLQGRSVDDLIFAFAILLDDRKDFLKNLKQSMAATADSADSSASDQEQAEPNTTYEEVVAKIIVLLAQPKVKESRDAQIGGSGNDEDKQFIEGTVKALQESVKVDAASKKIVDAFTDRVFQKEGFEMCDCGPNSFFGSLFGSLCN